MLTDVVMFYEEESSFNTHLVRRNNCECSLLWTISTLLLDSDL